MNEQLIWDEPIWPEPEMFKQGLDEIISKRVCQLPYLLDYAYVPDQNLYSIYFEAYCAFVYGLNNAGLMLLGQLLEITLKDIIYLKTGKKLKKKTFGNAIYFAKDHHIISENDINVLKTIMNLVRNPYAHRNLEEILHEIHVPIWGIPLDGDDPEDWLESTKKALDGIRSGQYKPSYIRASEDPSIAAIVKSGLDEKLSIYWAWKIFFEFEILINSYLPYDEYQKFIQQYGSPFDDIPLLNLDDE